MRSVPALRNLIPLVIPVLLLSGCAVGDFVGAYFNTYYNARRAFVEAEEELLKTPPLRPAGAEQEFLPPFTVPGGAKTKFATVIEKCSKLLQYHPESAFVDDALLMIGKSYYYQNEHQQAERKFRELLDRFADGDLAYETRLLLANTLYRARDRDGARRLARTLADDAGTAGERGALAGASLLLAHLALGDQDSAAALLQFERAAETAESADERADARLTSADVRARLNRPAEALRDYRLAADEARSAQTEYRARIGAARMLTRLGEFEAARGILEDLLGITANRDSFGEIEHEIGNVLRAEGDIEGAIRQYEYVDTAYVRTEFAARAGYDRGRLYEDSLGQYDSARVAYQRARSLAGQSAVAPLVTKRADLFTRYHALRSELARQESLRTLILDPPDSILAIQDSILAYEDSVQQARRDSIARTLKPAPDTALASRADSVRVTVPDSTARTVPDSALTAAADSAADAVPDSAHTAAAVAAGVPPEAALTAVVDSAAGAVPDSALMTAADSAAGASPDSGRPRRVRPPLVTIPLDTINARIAANYSEIGSLFLTGFERRDSAEHWFGRLLGEFPNAPQVPRALYAMAQLSRRDTAGVALSDSLYSVLAERHRSTEFGLEAARRLGMVVDPDSDKAARTAYQLAVDAMLAGRHAEAVREFRSVRTAFPSSPLASRAAYAVGWIYEQSLAQPESALAVYRGILETWPRSEAADAVRPKITAIDQHLQQEARGTGGRDSAGAAPAPSTPPVNPDVKPGAGAPPPPDLKPDEKGNPDEPPPHPPDEGEKEPPRDEPPPGEEEPTKDRPDTEKPPPRSPEP